MNLFSGYVLICCNALTGVLYANVNYLYICCLLQYAKEERLTPESHLHALLDGETDPYVFLIFSVILFIQFCTYGLIMMPGTNSLR